MSNQHKFTRRQLLGSSLVSTAPLSAFVQAQEQQRKAGFAKAIAQDYVLVAERPSPDLITDDPALTRLPSEKLLATWTFRGTRGPKKFGNAERFQLARSDNDGQTWRRLRPLDLVDGMTFVHDGKLYLIGNRLNKKDIVISRSDDEGTSWLPMSTLFEGTYWNVPSGYAIANGQIYRAFTSPLSARPVSVVAGDLSKDLLNPKAWRISSPVPYPGTPDCLKRKKYPPGVIKSKWTDHWLEPNVVYVRGRLMVLVRVRIAQYATSNICAICDLVDDGKKLHLKFTQFCSMPGGQHKFHIIYDDVSRLFWSPVNLATDSQNSQGLAHKLWKMRWHSGMGNERRFLMLYYSLDALNWFQACCIAMSTKPLQSFMYAAPLVDGDDMLILSRTSKNGRNQHDADLITFHRIRDFRSLALNLFPEL